MNFAIKSSPCWISVTLSILSACSGGDFAGSTNASMSGQSDQANQTPSAPQNEPSVSTATPGSTPATIEQGTQGIKTAEGISVMVKPCSKPYQVPATANPYLAGMPAGSTITYSNASGNKTDSAPAQSPSEVIFFEPSCLTAGAKLYFDVSGTISHGGEPATNADGSSSFIQHSIGAKFGKSNIAAPIQSFVGVFLDGGNVASQTPPALLDYSVAGALSKDSYSPALNQVFFIGDGKNQNGEYQKFVVPNGAVHFYMAIMDGWQWNNNTGSLQGMVLWQP